MRIVVVTAAVVVCFPLTTSVAAGPSGDIAASLPQFDPAHPDKNPGARSNAEVAALHPAQVVPVGPFAMKPPSWLEKVKPGSVNLKFCRQKATSTFWYAKFPCQDDSDCEEVSKTEDGAAMLCAAPPRTCLGKEHWKKQLPNGRLQFVVDAENPTLHIGACATPDGKVWSSPYCPCSHRKHDIGGCGPNPDRKHTMRFGKEMTVCMQFPQSDIDTFTVLDDYAGDGT